MTTEPASDLFERAEVPEAIAAAVAAAAPTAVDSRADRNTRGGSATISMQAHSAGADAKYMLGRRYAEWCTGAPQLEAAVAVAATAQDELGHTRSFYPVLRGFPDDLELYQSGMEEVGWQQRPVTALQVLRKPFKNWAELIAANVVVERALNVLFKAAIDSPYSPLRQRARKILSEEPRHDAHVEVGWSG